jgi:hypothetical protein
MGESTGSSLFSRVRCPTLDPAPVGEDRPNASTSICSWERACGWGAFWPRVGLDFFLTGVGTGVDRPELGAEAVAALSRLRWAASVERRRESASVRYWEVI